MLTTLVATATPAALATVGGLATWAVISSRKLVKAKLQNDKTRTEISDLEMEESEDNTRANILSGQEQIEDSKKSLSTDRISAEKSEAEQTDISLAACAEIPARQRARIAKFHRTMKTLVDLGAATKKEDGTYDILSLSDFPEEDRDILRAGVDEGNEYVKNARRLQGPLQSVSEELHTMKEEAVKNSQATEEELLAPYKGTLDLHTEVSREILEIYSTQSPDTQGQERQQITPGPTRNEIGTGSSSDVQTSPRHPLSPRATGPAKNTPHAAIRSTEIKGILEHARRATKPASENEAEDKGMGE
ncbi:hypothetical protein [Nocardiopsis sp. SBT366]|uniref:hypothetical protein n=1 Tax=Nocardiopsis sp. SBT366 TaxID=1580529 RepID=UPI000A64F97F|nr:hypothetical protein [Nocardiopsis sp. SBT366]